jgi:hypothetical protein
MRISSNRFGTNILEDRLRVLHPRTQMEISIFFNKNPPVFYFAYDAFSRNVHDLQTGFGLTIGLIDPTHHSKLHVIKALSLISTLQITKTG